MNETERILLTKARLATIGLSSFFVILPQALWSAFGYRGAPFIVIDTLSVFVGFIMLVVGLMTPPPKIILKVASAFSGISDMHREPMERPSRRAYLAFLMVPYIFVSYGIAYGTGFNLPPIWIILVFLAISSFCVWFLIHLSGLERKGRHVKPLFYYSIVGILAMVWTVSFWYGSPAITTDEFALNYYSAHLFLMGINPYVASNTAGVYSYLNTSVPGFPYNIITPYTTGGYVTELTYPALSMLAYVPANMFKAFPSATFLPFFAILPLIFYRAYSKTGLKSVALIPAFLILLDPAFLNQASLGYPDILWVISTLLSVYIYKKPGISGLLMGISAAVKQIPWMLIPFFLIFIYRESGGKASLKWILAVLSMFFAINSVFILESPADFVRSMTAPELQQLVGIGFGPSQFAFLDIIPVSRTFFALMAVGAFMVATIVYIAYYHRLRFAFLAFPILIFLFNYRLLLNYILYWPVIAFLIPVVMEARKEGSFKKKQFLKALKSPYMRKVAIPAIAVVLLLTPVFYQVSGNAAVSHLDVSKPRITSLQKNNVTGMSFTVSINSTTTPPGDLQVRILPFSPYNNMNGYLWKTLNYTQISNRTYTIGIVPFDSGQEISWNGSYRVLVYYGSDTGAINFRVHSGIIQ